MDRREASLGIDPGTSGVKVADVLGRPVRRCRTENVTALGAARLGWLTLGHELTGAGMELEDAVAPSGTFDYGPRCDRFQHLTKELAG
ncbi:MAG TPA: hypothetical protein VF391_16525 [Dermatophilaceae bacterium]